jgi:UDP-N-acetylmuramoylalanine--D-glutamate ligase
MTSFAGRRVLVVGLGSSGFAAARALIGLDAKVRVTEGSSGPTIEERADWLRREGAEVETGGHDLERLDADIAVVSPGVPAAAPVIGALADEGIEVISEVELGFQLARCEFLAVTGTNGKTTTTTLLAAMLAEGGIGSLAAGNIGLPLIEAVFEVPEGGAIAVEVSSFQLASIQTFRPRVAVVLNVAEDHTDWHGTFEDYVRAKSRIVENQQHDDVFVPNYEDPHAMAAAGTTRARVVPFSARRVPPEGVGLDGGWMQWRGRRFLAAADVPLAGEAGLEDALAASAAALEYGVAPDAVVRALRGFRPLAHRLQLVTEVGGVAYVDDSKATNPHAALSAVRGMRDVVLIAGGRSKGIDLTPLRNVVPPVIAVIAVGEARQQLAAIFEGVVPVEIATDMEDAVRRAARHSVPGGSVLLSPGCASLDMYESYAARGEHFVRAVKNLLEAREG